MNKYSKENQEMYNTKEIFSEENFSEMDLTDLIYSAMDAYEEETHFNTYIWVSLDTLKAEKGSRKISELKNLKNGFIVEITDKPGEDTWESIVRSFVEYINENFDRDFEYSEWYEALIEENDEKAFTDKQLYSVFDTCHDICLENRYEEDPYYIMIDMENYRAVKSVKKPEPADDRYVFIPIEPLSEDEGLTDVYGNCIYALTEYFDTEFEINMLYNFEVY